MMKFVAGHPALDFVNTVGGRVRANNSDRVLRDKLVNFADLLTFGGLAGVISPPEARSLSRQAARYPREAARTLARAIRLRESLYRILRCQLEAWRPGFRDLKTLTGEIEIARRHERLVLSANAFAWRWESKFALDGVVGRIARAAADLLTSGNLSLLRQCGGEECGWLFLDTSRNHARRWCDMKDCGNRAKVRSFRRRQARRGESHK